MNELFTIMIFDAKHKANSMPHDNYLLLLQKPIKTPSNPPQSVNSLDIKPQTVSLHGKNPPGVTSKIRRVLDFTAFVFSIVISGQCGQSDLVNEVFFQQLGMPK